MKMAVDEASWALGVDIGGTFTDCVAVDRDGTIHSSKVATTPDDLTIGLLNSLKAVARTSGTSLEELLGESAGLYHGTTVGLNTLVTRSGPRVGLLTTRGFEETALIMNGGGRSAGLSVEELAYVQGTSKPAPFVPRPFVRGVDERVDAFGEVLKPLDRDDCRKMLRELRDAGVEAIAICFLGAFANDAHERAAARIASEMDQDWFVATSAAIAPRLGEYQRMVTTIANAYLGPVLGRYTSSLSDERTAAGAALPRVFFMQSTGGLSPAERVASNPVLTIASGPVGGVVGARDLAHRLNRPNVIATDMGGTTFDVAVIHGGTLPVADTTIVDQHELYLTGVDVRSVGAGGGSLAWVDPASGGLRVGPASAGADPGPACYGRGGTNPTVTDADVVLGLINPDHFLSGDMPLDADAAAHVVGRLAGQLGISITDAAAGIVHIVDSKMADLIRSKTLESGYDPRDFSVLAYGGNGPVHAASFSAELGVDSVIVPLGAASAGFSALGIATADVHLLRDSPVHTDLPLDMDWLRDGFARLDSAVRGGLVEDGFAETDMQVGRFAGFRYKAQVHSVLIAVDEEDLAAEDDGRLSHAFAERYAQLYGEAAAFPDAGIELSLIRSSGSVSSRSGPAPVASAAIGQQSTNEARPVYWVEKRGLADTPVLGSGDLRPGATWDGPVIVELPTTTVVVRPEQLLHVDEIGNLVISRLTPVSRRASRSGP